MGRTGRTIRSGFPCAPPPPPSPLAARRIISRACSRLALLSAPISPSWIRARLNGLNAGAGGTVDISAAPLKVTGRASIESERRECDGDSDSERPRQRSICTASSVDRRPSAHLEALTRADGGHLPHCPTSHDTRPSTPVVDFAPVYSLGASWKFHPPGAVYPSGSALTVPRLSGVKTRCFVFARLKHCTVVCIICAFSLSSCFGDAT